MTGLACAHARTYVSPSPETTARIGHLLSARIGSDARPGQPVILQMPRRSPGVQSARRCRKGRRLRVSASGRQVKADDAETAFGRRLRLPRCMPRRRAWSAAILPGCQRRNLHRARKALAAEAKARIKTRGRKQGHTKLAHCDEQRHRSRPGASREDPLDTTRHQKLTSVSGPGSAITV